MNQLADVVLTLNPNTSNAVNFTSDLDSYETQVEVSYKRSFVTETGNERFSRPIRRKIVRFRLKPTNINTAKINAILGNMVAVWSFSTPLSTGNSVTQTMRVMSISPASATGTGILGTYYRGLEITLRAVESDV